MITVIGAGMGGLSAAIALAAEGHEVLVVEASARAGGKVGIATHDGVEFDTGPSVLTLPEVVDEVFRRGQTSLAGELELVEKSPSFEYRWPDGTRLDIQADLDATLQGVRDTLGAEAAEDLAGFMSYARRVWQAAAPNFVFSKAPTFGSVLGLGLRSLTKLRDIDPLHTMGAAVEGRVRSPHLRDLLLRYATYNGSDPYQAPATLNCIAWVELGLGCWGVRGGMYELVRALERVARRMGVRFAFETTARKIAVERGRVVGVTTDADTLSCDAVVVNADVAHLVDDLLAGSVDAGVEPPKTPSMSGWTGVLRARRRPAAKRPPHTVVFPADYRREFTEIFDHDRPPTEPTVYVCAPEKAHARAGWDDDEPLFVMANAPAEPADGARSAQIWAELRHTVLDRLRDHGLIDPDDALVWERTPAGLAGRFPGSRGSIYGAASNSQFAAFRRPPNRPAAGLDGLYLASGSAHPGGGVPLCLQSGLLAAEAVGG